MKPLIGQLDPQPRRALGVAFLLLCSGLLLTPAAAQEPLRVAVIDAGGEHAVPPEAVELLVVQLSQQKGLAVLERQEIDAILREQERSLALAGDASADEFVDAGKILGADALIVLRGGPPTTEKLQPIDAEVVETRRGIRLGSTSLGWSTAAGAAPDEQIAAATRHLTAFLARFDASSHDFTLIALAGLRSSDQSQTAHRLRRDFEAGLLAWLATQPGLAVAERAKVLPLIDERRIASDLPAALGGADVLIDGNFALDFTGDRPKIKVNLRVTLRDGSVRIGELEALLEVPEFLRDGAGRLVLELLDRESPAKQFDSQAEADLLIDEVERLLRVERSADGFQRATAAYALAPDDERVHRLLLRTSERLSFGYDLAGDRSDAPFYPKALLLTEVARKDLDRIAWIPVDKSEEGERERQEELRPIGNVFRQVSLNEEKDQASLAAHATEHEWLRAALQDLYAKYLPIAAQSGGQIYEEALANGLEKSVTWSRSAEEALDQRFDLFTQAAAVEKHRFDGWLITGSSRYDLDDNPTWTDRSRDVELCEAHLRRLIQSENPVLRARGECEAAQFALQTLKDRPRALSHYAKFIDLIVDELIPAGGALADEANGHWLDLNHRTGMLALTSDEAGDFWSRVIRARFAPSLTLPRATQPWEQRISDTVEQLKLAGRSNEADELLQFLIDRLGGVRENPDAQYEQRLETAINLQELRESLDGRTLAPSDVPTEGSVQLVDCETVLTPDMVVAACTPAEGAPKRGWMFTGFVPTPTGYAVSCSYVDGMKHTNGAIVTNRREWVAVARLDSQGRIISATMFPTALDSDAKASRTSFNPFNRPMRPLAALDGGIFVGPPMHGVLWFPLEGTPVHFTSEALDASDETRRPFPFDEVQRLMTMHGKLYVATGHPIMRPVLHVFDFKSGVVRVVFDAGSDANASLLRGRGAGISFEAGPPGHMLIWAKSHFPPRPMMPPLGDPRLGPPPRDPARDLLVMNLADRSVREFATPIELAFPGAIPEFQYRLGVQTPDSAMAVFDTQQLRFEWLIGGDRHASDLVGQHLLSNLQLAANDRFVLATKKRPRYASEVDWNRYTRSLPHDDRDVRADWVLYDRATGAARALSAEELPDGEKAWSFYFADDSSALLMTTRAIFRVTLSEVVSNEAAAQ